MISYVHVSLTYQKFISYVNNFSNAKTMISLNGFYILKIQVYLCFSQELRRKYHYFSETITYALKVILIVHRQGIKLCTCVLNSLIKVVYVNCNVPKCIHNRLKYSWSFVAMNLQVKSSQFYQLQHFQHQNILMINRYSHRQTNELIMILIIICDTKLGMFYFHLTQPKACFVNLQSNYIIYNYLNCLYAYYRLQFMRFNVSFISLIFNGFPIYKD